MTRTMTAWSAAALIALLGAFPSAADETATKGAPAKGAVKVAYVPAGYYLPFLVLVHEKLMEKRGYLVELQTFNDNTHMLNLFVNGHLDFTAQGAMSMFPIEAQYPGRFQFIYGQYCESYFWVVPASAPFRSLADLKGQAIGTWKSPTAEAYIRLTMRRAGVKDDDYSIRRYGASELASQLENGTVGVIFAFDIPAARLTSTGHFRYLQEDAISRLLKSRQVFNGGAFVDSKLASRDPKKLQAIREALFEALDIMKKKPDLTTKILADELKTPLEVVRQARLDRYAKPDGQMLKAADETMKLLLSNGLIDRRIETRKMFPEHR